MNSKARQTSALHWLVPLIAVLALVQAIAGLFWPGGGAPFTFATLHGERVIWNARSHRLAESLAGVCLIAVECTVFTPLAW